eukprot:5356275-Pyramimonas_sp.AAC.1
MPALSASDWSIVRIYPWCAYVFQFNQLGLIMQEAERASLKGPWRETGELVMKLHGTESAEELLLLLERLIATPEAALAVPAPVFDHFNLTRRRM